MRSLCEHELYLRYILKPVKLIYLGADFQTSELNLFGNGFSNLWDETIRGGGEARGRIMNLSMNKPLRTICRTISSILKPVRWILSGINFHSVRNCNFDIFSDHLRKSQYDIFSLISAALSVYPLSDEKSFWHLVLR